jgi:hypothetical protein
VEHNIGSGKMVRPPGRSGLKPTLPARRNPRLSKIGDDRPFVWERAAVEQAEVISPGEFFHRFLSDPTGRSGNQYAHKAENFCGL